MWRLCIFLLLKYVYSGHEVLLKVKPSEVTVLPHEIAIVQFDSRPLGSYWNVTAMWNQHYAHKHGHKYYYLSRKFQYCGNNETPLGMPWCKVHSMLKAHNMTDSSIKMFIFMDSDILISVNSSLSIVLTYIQQDLQWDWEKKPVAFNQDGPGYACKQAYGLGYSPCLNSGVVVWRKTSLAYEILSKWWESSTYDLSSNQFPMNWKSKWPWEQAQQYEIYQSYRYSIQILSFPKEIYLPWTSSQQPKSQYPTDFIEPWCLTHWPGANCFLTHYCASKKQKIKMMQEYAALMEGAEKMQGNKLQKKQKQKQERSKQQGSSKKISDFQPQKMAHERFLPVQVYGYIDEME